jgi:ribosomal protein S12 methylthiotransferase
VNFYLESLGCPKNLVDSQGMARLLKSLGHQSVADPRQAQLLIVNTCGFIADARDESISELRQLARRKRPDQMLIAAGCLSQRWGLALADHVPGLDALLGTRRWSEIASLVEILHHKRRELTRNPGAIRVDPTGRPAEPTGRPVEPEGLLAGPLALLDDPTWDAEVGRLLGSQGQRYARQGATSYLKLADGCSAPCGFCAIPLIKGPAVSRPADAIVADAQELVQQGVKEIILIAQDTTAYGQDLGHRDALSALVEAILDAVLGSYSDDTIGLHWLRLMYAYPGHVSSRLIKVLASDPRVCHYLDLPLQHAHPAVLRRMRRPSAMDRTRRLLSDLRAAMPDLALRTSFIVGYPGETEAEFEALLDFVAEIRPDHMGAFLYSPEKGTFAATLADVVPEAVKAERRDRLMALQQEISREKNQTQVGLVLDVLIEGAGDGLTVGRSYRDAPEIDGLVFVSDEQPVGEVVQVLITGAMEYDLVGEVVEGNHQ